MCSCFEQYLPWHELPPYHLYHSSQGSSLLLPSIQSPTRVLIPSCLSVTLSPKIPLYLTSKVSTLIWVDLHVNFRIFHLISSYSSLLDVDECFQGTHNCNLGEEYCVNNAGGFKCECRDGYNNPNGTCEGEWTNFLRLTRLIPAFAVMK